VGSLDGPSGYVQFWLRRLGLEEHADRRSRPASANLHPLRDLICAGKAKKVPLRT
jgi:hypothetical protein